MSNKLTNNLPNVQDIEQFTKHEQEEKMDCNGFCGEYECKENQENCKRKAQGK